MGRVGPALDLLAPAAKLTAWRLAGGPRKIADISRIRRQARVMGARAVVGSRRRRAPPSALCGLALGRVNEGSAHPRPTCGLCRIPLPTPGSAVTYWTYSRA
jgi:hypothetical protein